jgi:hypothetical protein
MKLMIKGNKFIISTSLFFFFALCSTKAQVRLYEDSIFRAQDTVREIKELLYNKVYKNIASFNIKYANFRMNGSTPADMFRSDADLDYSYGCFLPDEGYKLRWLLKTRFFHIQTAGIKSTPLLLIGLNISRLININLPTLVTGQELQRIS